MGDEELGTQGESQPVGYAPQYGYGAQWFDDMGSLTLAFPASPTTAYDVGSSSLSREEINMFSVALSKNLKAPYEQEGL